MLKERAKLVSDKIKFYQESRDDALPFRNEELQNFENEWLEYVERYLRENHGARTANEEKDYPVVMFRNNMYRLTYCLNEYDAAERAASTNIERGLYGDTIERRKAEDRNRRDENEKIRWWH